MPTRSPRPPTYTLSQVSARSPLLNAWPFNASNPLGQIGLHSHQCLSILFFEQGTGFYQLGQRTVTIYPGAVVLVPPGELHSWDAAYNLTGWLLFFMAEAVPHVGAPPSLWWNDPLLAPFTHQSPHPGATFTLSSSLMPLWSAWMQTIHNEVRHERADHVAAACAYLTLLLVDLARLAQPDLARRTARVQPLLSAVFAYIDQAYHQPISLAAVAAAAGLTPGHLTTVVRRHTGRTVVQWLQERRMAAARRQLVETDDSVAAIATEVGYRDVAYFTRLFRRAHGMPPLAWRKAAR
ncbi:MAG: helix-turn-helix transcriptional regulator [Chloroflexales bacterium]|nr:helix-turn-helix transcriptional regulator [Chloroflexales bacterium]